MFSGEPLQKKYENSQFHFRETVAHAIAEQFAINGLAFQSRP